MQPDPPPLTLSDQHTIETPEQMPLALDRAGVGSRFLALALDTLIQFGVGILALLIVGAFSSVGLRVGLANAPMWLIAVFSLLVFLLMYGYFAIFEIVWNGQTPGKRVVKIRVVKDSGRPLTPVETIARNLLRIVDSLPGFYLIGIVTALLNGHGKRLGDLVAGSIVVRESSFEEIRPAWEHHVGSPGTMGPQGPPPLPIAGVAGVVHQLTMEDLALIDAFLSRRDALPWDVRARMADQIAARMRVKLPGLGFDGRSNEAVLEALAYERRSGGRLSL